MNIFSVCRDNRKTNTPYRWFSKANASSLTGIYYFWLGFLVFTTACSQERASLSSSNLGGTEGNEIREILQVYPLVPLFKSKTELNGNFCSTFYSAIMKNQGISYIPPSIRSDNQEDASLFRYSECRTYSDWPPGIENSDLAFHDLRSIGNRDFRVYPLSQRSGKKTDIEVVYAAPSVVDLEKNNYAGFYVIDFKQCLIKTSVSAPEFPETRKLHKPVSNVNALAKFEKSFVIVSVWDTLTPALDRVDGKRSYLATATEIQRDGSKGEVCSWGEKSLN